MKTNKIIGKIRSGEKPVGAVLTFPSEEIVELLGIAGIDFVHFDAQHGAMSPESIERLCRAAELAGLTPTLRVPSFDAATVLSYLDRGIMGITGPDVDSKEQAEELANACRYAPEGKRSYGSGRGNHFGVLDDRNAWMAHINANILVTAQIESVTALNNLDHIMTVPGIDLFTFGPNDLAQSMGFTGQPDHPRVKEAIARAQTKIRQAGKKVSSDVLRMFRVPDLIVQAVREQKTLA